MIIKTFNKRIINIRIITIIIIKVIITEDTKTTTTITKVTNKTIIKIKDSNNLINNKTFKILIR